MQKRKKVTSKDQKEDHPLLQHNTHTWAARTTYCTEQRGPAALLYLTHTNPPAHMRFISALFKVPRTGNHYESMPLTPTLWDEKLCVCLTLVLHCSSDPKKTLKLTADKYKRHPLKAKRRVSPVNCTVCVVFLAQSIWGSYHKVTLLGINCLK